MIIYCMSDIHGCLAEFEDALSLVLDDIEQGKAKLVLLGDYIHGGPDNRGVLDRIMRLRERFGSDRIIALLGNHDEWVVNGSSTISNNSVYALSIPTVMSRLGLALFPSAVLCGGKHDFRSRRY